MPRRRRSRRHKAKQSRVLLIVIPLLLVLFLLPFVVVQLPQYRLRHRADYLLHDFQEITLRETTWSDAQILMQRWSRWGHADGPCTAVDCQYEVDLSNAETAQRLRRFHLLGLYELLGFREAGILTRFIVQDGTIWRTSIAVRVAMPSTDANDPDYFMIAETRNRQSLHHDIHTESVFGADDQLAAHPYYKAGQPASCTSCKMVTVTYGIHTPEDQIDRLTTFDLSCFTRFYPCREIADILPASLAWQMYNWKKSEPPGSPSDPPRLARVPLWTLGRDVRTIFAVDALSGPAPTPGTVSRVRLGEVLKGTTPRQPGSEFQMLSSSDYATIKSPQTPEHITPGQRFIILFDPSTSGPLDLTQPPLRILEDTPQTRRALQKGFAENDTLRRPELP